MSAPSRRRWDYDLLRVASMVGVVYLHTAAGALRQLGTPLWHFSNLISSLATAAVPLFFMLSGALLLSHPRTAELGTLFRRRLPKVLIPLLAWSGVVIALAGVLSGPQAALDKLIPLLNTPVMVPYWFLYALVPIYLVSPLLKKMTDGLSEAHWNYLVGLWLIATIGMDTLCDLAPAGPWQSALTVHWTLNLDFVGGYLGYFLLGARLARLQKLPRRGTLWGVTAASFAVIAAGTFSTSRTASRQAHQNYLHLFTAVLAAACSLARSMEGRQRYPAPWGSFGVYLVHPMAIQFWQKAWTAWITPAVDTIPLQLGYYLAILLSCLAGVALLMSVKPLCWLFTGQSFSSACRECNLFALFRRNPSKQTPAS
ncbi:MAG: acyltransferase [Flavonifractor plautii]